MATTSHKIKTHQLQCYPKKDTVYKSAFSNKLIKKYIHIFHVSSIRAANHCTIVMTRHCQSITKENNEIQ